MPKPFCKLYREYDIGQILVKIDSAENEDYEAEVRIYFEPKNLGVCNIAFNYSDWEKAEEAFESVDEEKAIAIVEQLIEQSKDFTSDE